MYIVQQKIFQLGDMLKTTLSQLSTVKSFYNSNYMIINLDDCILVRWTLLMPSLERCTGTRRSAANREEVINARRSDNIYLYVKLYAY